MTATATELVWAVTPEKLREAVRRLVDAAQDEALRDLAFAGRQRRT